MSRIRTISLVTHGLTVLVLVGALGSACAQTNHKAVAADSLKIIDNPGGGQIVYGTLPNESSFGGGMAAMLRNVHGHFGDRPQVGKFFQTRGSESVAAFFTLTARNQGGKPIAGLVIVSMPQGSKPAGAVLYDDASRFTKTQAAMMQTLNQAWHTATTRTDAVATGSTPAAATHAPAPALHVATAGDRSASIGLPTGWQLANVSGGQLTATGPNGEMIYLGLMYQQIHDPRNMQNQRPPMPGAKGQALVYPYGGDLFAAFVSVSNQVRQNRQLHPGVFTLISSQKLAPTQYEQQLVQVIYEVDLQDGKGVRKASARIGEMATRGMPTWAMTVSGSNAPKAVADAQAPTLLAIIHSYNQDAGVISGAAAAVIGKIHAEAKAAQIRADAQSAANDAHNKAFNAHMDDIDRQSKIFQNYQLDRSQVQDNDLNTRGTASNTTAEALVRADPNRYQILSTQDYLKGVDY